MSEKKGSAIGPAREAEDPPSQGTGDAGDHEEWLLDESLAETFPASDPIAPALPPEPKAPAASTR